ncbi:P pilus assembly protein, pilin FimA [Cedecea lapagei]|uniref:P pilus assembly protein, pilin FimA n=1 Tax=Cedecea lapagei TaxID=158823 RepID=A0A3S4IKV6_9ENTR|nr:type 1 fimbrial protein [Cedecea lapagei]VEC01358.1 P pilus assembly protein, pilin FimA [Cedecea lapagei]
MTATTQDIRPEEPRPLFRMGGCGLASLALVVTGMVSGVRAEDYTVNGTITQGTCEVSFPTVTTGSLSLPPVSRNVMNDGSIQSMEGVPVQLSHCLGLNAAGKAPTLSITGTTVTDLPAGTGKYLFNNNESGAARGYGIVLSTEKLSKWTPSSQVSGDGSATSDVVLAPASLPYTGGTTDFYVGVGCGDAATCAAQDAGHAGGDITAGITFTFGYR